MITFFTASYGIYYLIDSNNVYGSFEVKSRVTD